MELFFIFELLDEVLGQLWLLLIVHNKNCI